MRVGFVTGEYPPMQGGVGAFTREVARAMIAQGHAAYIFTRADVTEHQGDEVQIASAVKRKWGWKTARLLREWAKANQLDIVNIQFQTAAFDMHPSIHWLPQQLHEMPVAVTFHDLRVPYLFPKAGPLRNWIVRKLARDADRVIATDRDDETRLRDHWHIPNVCWIPIGSNISTTPPVEFDRDIWRSQRGIQPDDLLISYFGFLNQSKGALILVEALACLIENGVPAYLVLIGGRAGSSDTTNLAYGLQVDEAIQQQRLDDRVHRTGFVADVDVTAAFYASDITALPYRDGVSLRRGTLMAALAHGRAIVTTIPETDVPELNGAVETVAPDDPLCLAATIRALWKNPARRQALEIAALNASANFTWDRIAARTIEYLSQIALP